MVLYIHLLACKNYINSYTYNKSSQQHILNCFSSRDPKGKGIWSIIALGCSDFCLLAKQIYLMKKKKKKTLKKDGFNLSIYPIAKNKKSFFGYLESAKSDLWLNFIFKSQCSIPLDTYLT